MKFILRRLLQPYWRLTRGLTLGAQGLVIDGDGRVLLVRHGYKAGWSFPGGGVEPSENAGLALRRELDEETGVIVEEKPQLHGIYTNFTAFPRDHIILFVVRAWSQPRVPAANREILEQGFFAPSALPTETTAGTRRRISEVIEGHPTSPEW